MFENFFNNWLFLSIIFLTIAVQIALVQFGGFAVKCSPLTLAQHLYCIGIGFLCLPFGAIFKLIPQSLFSCVKVNEMVRPLYIGLRP